jgi:hypothetical protein
MGICISTPRDNSISISEIIHNDEEEDRVIEEIIDNSISNPEITHNDEEGSDEEIKIDLDALKKDFDDETLVTILELTIESIENNILLIKKGLEDKNAKEIFRGCHSLKSLGFLGDEIFIVKKSAILTHMVRGKDYSKINLRMFNKLFTDFIQDSGVLKQKINYIIN